MSIQGRCTQGQSPGDARPPNLACPNDYQPWVRVISLHVDHIFNELSSFLGFMEREAQTLAPQEFLKQQLQHSMEDALDTESVVEPELLLERVSSEDRHSRSSSVAESPKTASSIRSFMQTLVKPRTRTTSANWSNIQVYRTVPTEDPLLI